MMMEAIFKIYLELNFKLVKEILGFLLKNESFGSRKI